MTHLGTGACDATTSNLSCGNGGGAAGSERPSRSHITSLLAVRETVHSAADEVAPGGINFAVDRKMRLICWPPLLEFHRAADGGWSRGWRQQASGPLLTAPLHHPYRPAFEPSTLLPSQSGSGVLRRPSELRRVAVCTWHRFSSDLVTDSVPRKITLSVRRLRTESIREVPERTGFSEVSDLQRGVKRGVKRHHFAS